LGGIFDLCGYIGNLRLTDGRQSGARDFWFCRPFNDCTMSSGIRRAASISGRTRDDVGRQFANAFEHTFVAALTDIRPWQGHTIPKRPREAH
jgi:hypothetical protein